MFDKVERRKVIEGELNIVPHTTKTNFLIVAVAGLGSFLFGYANNVIAGSLAQVSFGAYFLSGPNASSIIGGILGGFLGGGFIGAVIQAPISNKYGRRVASGTAAIILVISGALQAGSVHIAMFITFRIICGIGAGMLITNTPVYMSEVSPAHTRGLLVGSHAVSIGFGYVLSSVFALAFHFVNHPVQWRLQFIVLTFFALLLLLSLFFIPESPRWLVENGRYDEALEILERLHKAKNDPEAKLARAEMIQIRAQVDKEKSLPSGYIYIMKTPHLRKRAFCSILISFMGQASGILVIAGLTPVLFGGLGYGILLQFGLSIVWVTLAFLTCIASAFIMDKVGRVKLLVFGGYSCTLCLIGEAILQKYFIGSDNTAGINAALAFFFLFIVFYGLTIDATAYVYVSEIWPTHLRSQGGTFGISSFFLCALVYSSPASLAFQNIGWKYYIVFIVICPIAATIILFYFPETAGLTLEEINEKFGDTVEVKMHDIHLDAAHEVQGVLSKEVRVEDSDKVSE